MIGIQEFIIMLVLAAVFVFWGWMMLDMFSNKKIKAEIKVVWLIGFLLLSILTATFYYFTHYTSKRK